MDVIEILQLANKRQGSDILVVPGARVSMKVAGKVTPITEEILTPDGAKTLVEQAYALCRARSMERVLADGDDDFSFSLNGVGRFRCNAYLQRNSLAMVLRVLSFETPDVEKLHIPEEVLRLARVRKGLVLITGPAGSGKSTTLACLIDRINRTCSDHIITIENPIEFVHPHQKSIVSQREVELDTKSYATALRAALRQAPDVIQVGEMRDLETISTALTAAETGQLVLSTLHTIGAAKTIDRIIDVFPASQQQQIRVQLSMVLRAVVSQQLLPGEAGELVPAFEIMLVNGAIQNMIRESKTYQMETVIYAGAEQGMRTMDEDILRLYRAGSIGRETALIYAASPEAMAKKLG